jgi:DNA-binding response OmpR family regulator
VLIVEDNAVVSTDVEHALTQAGYDVCGVAFSEREAIEMAKVLHPTMAVLDVKLAPGDGRNVARDLAAKYGTTILMATAESISTLDKIGAVGVVPKPYDANVIPAALAAAEAIAADEDPGVLPDHMKRLR